jgi:hypothetical protein
MWYLISVILGSFFGFLSSLRAITCGVVENERDDGDVLEEEAIVLRVMVCRVFVWVEGRIRWRRGVRNRKRGDMGDEVAIFAMLRWQRGANGKLCNKCRFDEAFKVEVREYQIIVDA